jgi:threonine synthase
LPTGKLIPEGKIALGKLAQAMIHGAVIIQIKGNFDDGMRFQWRIAFAQADKVCVFINR